MKNLLTGRGRGQGGQAVVAAALLCLLAFTIGLTVNAWQAERSHRATADRALRDYAAVAAWQYARRVSEVLHNEIATSTAPVSDFYRARRGSAIPPPSVLIPTDSIKASCGILKKARFAFRLDLRTGELSVAGVGAAALDGRTRTALADRSLAFIRRTPVLSDPHRVLIDTIAGVERAIAYGFIRDSASGVWAAYGVEAPGDVADSVIGTIPREYALLPATLIGAGRGDSVVAVRLTAADGWVIFQRGTIDARFAATDTVDSESGEMTVTVGLEPRLASSLLIGGLPRSRLPALLALLVLSVLLSAVALVQLRRSRELARLRNQFVANVSHELRTPLSQISMFSETLLLGRERSADERRHFLSVIFRETRRLASLVESVLRFSRGEAAATRLRPEARDIGIDARETLATFAPLATAAGAELRAQIDEGAYAMVDTGALRQILLNLLDNAVKYGGEGEAITVRVVRGGDEVVISVDDEGPGIPAEDRRRVFDPFERLERRGAPKTSGAGIGLTVVRDLVTALAGRVWIEDAPGGGARVAIALRAVDTPPGRAGDGPARDERPADDGVAVTSRPVG